MIYVQKVEMLCVASRLLPSVRSQVDYIMFCVLIWNVTVGVIFTLHPSFSSFKVDRVSVTAETGASGRPTNRPGGGVMRIHRHFPYPANQMYVVVLHRELKPMRVYRLNVSFDAAIEDELLGFFRSSYTLQRERRYAPTTHTHAHTQTHLILKQQQVVQLEKVRAPHPRHWLTLTHHNVCVPAVRLHTHCSLPPYEIPISLWVVFILDLIPKALAGSSLCADVFIISYMKWRTAIGLFILQDSMLYSYKAGWIESSFGKFMLPSQDL